MLTIFYLTDNSRHFTFDYFVKLLNFSKTKDKWGLLVLTHTFDQDFYHSILQHTNITYNILNVPHENNYMTKVRNAIHYAKQNNHNYMMKCDNDIFITPQTLDYIVENLNLLDDPKNLTIGPTLSSGIPSVEYFIEKFVTPEQKNHIESLFLKSQFYDRDGASYTYLNSHTIGSLNWNKTAFFKDVKNMDHHYKGVHPIRINYEAIDYLNNCILENKQGFFTSMPTGIIKDDISPYLCDSIFCIKTDIYEKIINDSSLFVDGYDEVPLNKYAWNNGCSHLFVENGFAIHILYNWFSDLHSYEMNFCNKLFA
jgi:hypothetical protein